LPGAEFSGFRAKPAHLLLLSAAAALRVVFLLAAGGRYMTADYRSWPMDDDSHQYVRYAEDLRDGTQDEPSVRMPLYPLFLAVTWSDGRPWLAALLLQQAMGLFIGILCCLAASFVHRKAGLPAGLAAMLFPQHVLHSTRIMPDTAALLAVCASGFLWLRARRTDSARGFTALMAAVGLTLSLGAMCKQVLLYSPAVYGIMLLAVKKPGAAARFGGLAAMTAVFLVLPLSWRAFNRANFGFDGYSTQDAFEPLGRAAILAGLTDQRSVWDGSFTGALDSLAMVDGRLDLGVRDSIYRARTREIVLAEPVRILVPHLVSWPRFFSVGYAHKILRSIRVPEEGIPLAACKVLLGVVYAVMAAGAFLGLALPGLRRRMGPLNGLLTGWLLFSALVYGPLATTRYGLTFFWIMLVNASTVFTLLWEDSKNTSRQAAAKGTSAQ
jgi:4-amino-4-deoxy-L-arabinose transferase-like glycosyltransferase